MDLARRYFYAQTNTHTMYNDDLHTKLMISVDDQIHNNLSMEIPH